jgi:hypothetical protein
MFRILGSFFFGLKKSRSGFDAANNVNNLVSRTSIYELFIF